MVTANDSLKQSWQRSRNYGIDPFLARDAVLSLSEFNQYREHKVAFLQEIESTVQHLYTCFKSSQATVIVADASGYILESIGDAAFMKESEKVHLMNGACWDEKIRGTNAIGTAITEQKPVAVVGSEHYLEANHFLWCAASPIFNLEGDLTAVLDVSGPSPTYHPSVLMMIEMIARNIEDWMFMRSATKHIVINLSSEQEKLHRALLLVDENDRIVGLNREARKHFKLGHAFQNGIYLSSMLTGAADLLLGNRIKKKEHEVKAIGKEKEQWRASVVLDTRPRKFKVSFERSHHQSDSYTFQSMIAKDLHFQSTLDLANRAAKTDYTILIHGESGTGKELVAHSIHQASHRASQPFIALNCGAITKTLMESELFGYEAGSFTGAKKSGNPGKIEAAHGGTLFLDEIAEMTPDMQIALLRFLQERSLTRVGSLKLIQVDIRIIAATHKDLWQEVQDGRFRADLYYRLQGITITLPPLRSRSDCLDLATHFLHTIAVELGKPSLTLTSEAKKLLSHYSWPGNVRELLAVLRQAAFLANGSSIEPSHFPSYIIKAQVKSRAIPNNHHQLNTLEQIEQDTILAALRETEGNISQTARLLGIGRNTLYRKLKKL